MNIPNTLTLIRIALIPVFVVAFCLPFDWARPASAIIFALAGITDWLDGYLARRLAQTSALGAFLDPVADKLMVAVALVLLVQSDPHLWLAIPAAVIIGREIAISGLREWMAEVGKRAHVRVAFMGKVKTTAQIAAIILWLYRVPLLDFPILPLAYILLYLASLLTLWSMFVYLRSAWPTLYAGRAPKEEREPLSDEAT
jgi:CDP-diacylglycerol--glycerol-3-phosphate 3-phosphatidyltransferase